MPLIGVEIMGQRVGKMKVYQKSYFSKILLFSIFILGFTLIMGCDKKQESTVDLSQNKVGENLKQFRKLHGNEKITYSLFADLDLDNKPEYVLITGEERPKVWFINSGNIYQVPYDSSGLTYADAFLLDRDGEKQLALILDYPPSNSQLLFFRVRDNKLKQIFTFTSDWKIDLLPNGFELIQKRYKPGEQGGYDLIGETYIWNKDLGTYKRES